MQKVIIKIKGGKVNLDFSGFQGKDCEKLADKIQPKNIEVESKELKPEYHFETGTDTDTDTEFNSF